MIIQDIDDSGLTLSYIVRHIKEREPESVKICESISLSEGRAYILGLEIKD